MITNFIGIWSLVGQVLHQLLLLGEQAGMELEPLQW